MKYNKVSPDVFKEIVIGAGTLLTKVTIGTDGEATIDEADILGPTNGGINFSDGINFTDFAEGIDNVPRNTMQLKRINNTDRAITASGTFRAANIDLVKKLMAAVTASDDKLTPKADLALSDFYSVWIICDYSDINTGNKAGFIAIEMLHVLHTGGFKLQTQNEDKGEFAFEFTAHYDIEHPDTVPYNVYLHEGTAA